MHQDIEPAIHYWGTPVVLVSTLNEDGSTNLSPMSSAWWLGWSCMLGLDASSQTVANLRRTGECVLNLAGVAQAEAVNRLALSTGTARVPLHKKLLGYEHVGDKFEHAGLSRAPSVMVAPAAVAECPVHLEARVRHIRAFAEGDGRMAVPAVSVELSIVRTVADRAILMDSHPHRVDPVRWRPLLMSFRRLFALGEECGRSRLHCGPEEAYAPWKQSGLRRAAGQAVSAWSHDRYGKNA